MKLKKLEEYVKYCYNYNPDLPEAYFSLSNTNKKEQVNFIRNKNIIFSEINFYMNVCKIILKSYETDELCDVFNSLNYKENINWDLIEGTPREVKATTIFADGLFDKHYVNNNINTNCFSKEGKLYFDAMLLKTEKKENVIEVSSCNCDHIFDVNFLFIEGINIEGKYYTFISLHNGNGSEDNYLPYIMVKENNRYGQCFLIPGGCGANLRFYKNDIHEKLSSIYPMIIRYSLWSDGYISNNKGYRDYYSKFEDNFSDVVWTKYYDKEIGNVYSIY